MRSLYDRYGHQQRFIVDGVFAGILAILFLSMHTSLYTLQNEVLILFLAGYTSLGLGVLTFYLLASMNFRIASLAHIGVFPFLNLFTTFSKWLPIIIPRATIQAEGLSVGLLAYIMTAIIYLIVQLLIHINEPQPERLRQFRKIS